MKIYEIPDSNLKITLDERVEENDLKKRIEQLENTLNILFEQNKYIEKLENRIDKAIEYINNNSLYEEEYDYDYEENIHLSGINDTKARNDLLNILKGSDKE